MLAIKFFSPRAFENFKPVFISSVKIPEMVENCTEIRVSLLKLISSKVIPLWQNDHTERIAGVVKRKKEKIFDILYMYLLYHIHTAAKYAIIEPRRGQNLQVVKAISRQ